MKRITLASITLFLLLPFGACGKSDVFPSIELDGQMISIKKVEVPYTNQTEKTFIKSYYNQEIDFSDVGILTPFSQRFGYPRKLSNIGNRIKIYLSFSKNIIGYSAPRFTAPWGDELRTTILKPSKTGISAVRLRFVHEMEPEEKLFIDEVSIQEMMKTPISDIRTCYVIFYPEGILVKTMYEKVFRQYNRGENDCGL